MKSNTHFLHRKLLTYLWNILRYPTIMAPRIYLLNNLQLLQNRTEDCNASVQLRLRELNFIFSYYYYYI